MANSVLIVVINGEYEAWPSLTKFCRMNKEWASYHTLKRKTLPFTHKNALFMRLVINRDKINPK